MKKLFEKTESQKNTGSLALKRGTYSLVISAVVLAILVVVNILVSVLPKTLTKYDISSSRLYSVTSSTKVVVNALQKNVTVYWIVQAEQEDAVIENLLEKYDSLSDHISVVKKNPDIYPTFAEQYTDETVQNNSLVVECGTKSRFISYDEIYLSDIDYKTYSQVYSFDGEGALTSAIAYVVSDELPVIYALEGHGEAELPEYFAKAVAKDNMEIRQLSLLKEDEIPADASCILIHSPESDISEEETSMLSEYLQNGGKLFVLAGPTENGMLSNVYSLLSDYGVSAAEGFVVEEDRNYYVQYPYLLLPEIESSDITDPLIESRYYILVAQAAGLLNNGSGSGTVTPLLMSSDTAYSKTAGFENTTYDREEGDTDGPFSLAVSAEDSSGGQLIFVSSSYFLDESLNAWSSGANLNFSMNALSALIGESEAVAIRSKSLSYNYLTISESTSTALKAVMIGIIPAVFVLIGAAVLIIRRRKRNAQA